MFELVGRPCGRAGASSNIVEARLALDDRLFAPRAGGDDRYLALDLVFQEADVIPGALWQVVVGRDADDGRAPSLHRPVLRLEVMVGDGEGGGGPPIFAPDGVGRATGEVLR